MTAHSTLNPVTLSTTRDDLFQMYRRMALIRGFEARAGKLYRDGKIPGQVHLALWQEASAVGACYYLRQGDVITSTHRGHGHGLAKGLEAPEVFAELMGKEGGVCRGRGGSMHIADPSRGIFGANGIVGAGLPIADGAAFAAKLRRTGGVAVAFLGDGAISTGAFHEAANLAALMNLPAVFFCENNRFSEFSSFDDQQPVEVAARAPAYGLQFRQVDGNDILAVSELMRDVLSDVRSGGRPYLIEALTLRQSGHYEGDPQNYRKGTTLTARDPIEVARAHLRAAGVTDVEVAQSDAETERSLDDAVAFAIEAPLPVIEDLATGMVVARPGIPKTVVEPEDHDSPERWKTWQALAAALKDELHDDPEVFIAGIDVGKGGNVFGLTRGMVDTWPDRVIDTPISETAIIGMGVGAAMAGMKPVVEVMYFDFIGVCLDQIMNQAAKLPYMTGGRSKMSLTIRTQFGAGRSAGAQHSQSLEAMLAHIPGLTVVMPSTPADAYGLLRTAIQDPNPVVFVEHRLQYGMKGYRCDPDYRVPIGQAAIRRVGTDVTIVTYSRMAQVCGESVEALARQGISCELIDLRTIAPLDVTTVLESVAKTSRLLIVHEAHRDFGVGAEIAARVAEEGLYLLDAPIMRIGAAPVPAPYSPILESAWLPDKDRIIEAAVKLANF